MKRWPALDANGGVELELRQLYELEDFIPGEALDRHIKLREQLTKK